MYISSDGTKKDTKNMDYMYLVNAFAKISREIFNSHTVEEYNKNIENLEALEKEIFERIDKHLSEKLDKGEWE